jgi:hypothetical protein
MASWLVARCTASCAGQQESRRRLSLLSFGLAFSRLASIVDPPAQTICP